LCGRRGRDRARGARARRRLSRSAPRAGDIADAAVGDPQLDQAGCGAAWRVVESTGSDQVLGVDQGGS
jgi:hypothetical protein